MKLVPYEREKLEGLGYKPTKLLALLDEFVQSGLDCVKVEGWTHKTAASCASSLAVAIKRQNRSGIRAVLRNGEVFLIKTN